MEEWQSISDIGRALSKHAGSVHGVVSSNGGIAPAALSHTNDLFAEADLAISDIITGGRILSFL